MSSCSFFFMFYIDGRFKSQVGYERIIRVSMGQLSGKEADRETQKSGGRQYKTQCLGLWICIRVWETLAERHADRMEWESFLETLGSGVI